MQELSNSIKCPNLRIMAIEEREKVQTNAVCYICSKITENLPNLKKVLPFQVQEIFRTTDRLDQNRTSPWHIITKTTSTENRERILKSIREKNQVTYKGKLIKTETLKARIAWSGVFQKLKEDNFNSRILSPAKLMEQ
jgi:hypothetical protein